MGLKGGDRDAGKELKAKRLKNVCSGSQIPNTQTWTPPLNSQTCTPGPRGKVETQTVQYSYYRKAEIRPVSSPHTFKHADLQPRRDSVTRRQRMQAVAPEAYLPLHSLIHSAPAPDPQCLVSHEPAPPEVPQTQALPSGAPGRREGRWSQPGVTEGQDGGRVPAGWHAARGASASS